MARRVYFAFHFERDIWRVNQVRMSNVVAGVEDAGFFDHSEYQEAKKKNPDEIARLIRKRLDGTSVTVVLIGRETASRPWVAYEIRESIARGNGMLGVYIHHLKDDQERADPLYPLPATPAVSVEFPLRFWDGDLAKFSGEIEAAGKRAERIALFRAMVLRKRRP